MHGIDHVILATSLRYGEPGGWNAINCGDMCDWYNGIKGVLIDWLIDIFDIDQ